jgi:hypothetical protein
MLSIWYHRFPEASGSDESCIFHGYLKNEPEAYVTMTGGCPFENSFEVICQIFFTKTVKLKCLIS